MKPEVLAFSGILVAALVFSQFVEAGSLDLANYRPEILSERPGVGDVGRILLIVFAGTAFLVVAKLLGLTLRIFVEAGAFAGAYYFVSPFLGDFAGISAGVLMVALRATPYLLFLNLSAVLSILSFAFLFGTFLSWNLVLLTISAMAVYDAVAVLYTKHMKFLWLGSFGNRFGNRFGVFGGLIEHPKWRETFALFFPRKGALSVIGAGDFALPATFVVSVASSGGFYAGLVTAAFLVLSFLLLEKISSDSEKTFDTGIPGIPPMALGACLAALFLISSGVLLPAF
ncbi:MAG: hypothetical protein V1820_00625 [archaeon]